MRAFIGVGPGRCGTVSLRQIVGACKNTNITHEAYPSDWYSAGPRIGQLIRNMQNSGETLTGEVSCNLLPHINRIRDAVRGLPVVCMHRSREETVQSLMGHLPPLLRPEDRRRRTVALEMDGWNPDKILRWPVIDAATVVQSWEFYWEYAEKLMQLVVPPVKHIWMRSLNDDFCIESIYNFLDIPRVDRVIPTRRNWNSTKERISGRRHSARTVPR